MIFKGEELRLITHTQLVNEELIKHKTIKGVSTDSRRVSEGELFVAIRGENFDGQNFLNDAFDKGAIAAVIDSERDYESRKDKCFVLVRDTVKAYGALAQLHRMKFNIPILAVAGSNGKTTTKDMITAVLRRKMKVLSTEGNLNNHIGVPATMLRLRKQHKAAVVEMGTNHPGEIEYLCSILAPTHGIVTNIGREHLEFFGSVEAVAEEEGALFDILRATKKSIAFVNADDPFVRKRTRGMKRTITYGIATRKADVRGSIARVNRSGCAELELASDKIKKSKVVQLKVPGEHNALNAVAAAAVGVAFGVPMTTIRSALSSFRPSEKRMEIKEISDVLILNDTYNANPDSLLSAIHTLANMKSSGKKILVLGDMLELGSQSEQEHIRAGEEIGRLGFDYVLTYGGQAKHIHAAIKGANAVHYEEKNMLAEYLSELIAPGDVVLVKGSRGMRMEDIITFLEERSKSSVAPIF